MRARALMMVVGGVACAIAYAAPAQAEVVTLTCSAPQISGAFIIDVDLSTQTVFVRFGSVPGKQYRAQITDRYITWSEAQIDRTTGLILWSGAPTFGNCQRASKPLF